MVISFTSKIRKIGNSFGFIIPKEILKKENLKVGDIVYIRIRKIKK